MKAEEFVKNKYPKAKCESHITNSNKRYWLIRTDRKTMYIASSDKSSSNVWVKAKTYIKESK